jgi:hypothetical protein
MEGLSLPNELVEGLQGLLKRSVLVESVHVIDVYVVGLKQPQALRYLRNNMLGR